MELATLMWVVLPLLPPATPAPPSTTAQFSDNVGTTDMDEFVAEIGQRVVD